MRNADKNLIIHFVDTYFQRFPVLKSSVYYIQLYRNAKQIIIQDINIFLGLRSTAFRKNRVTNIFQNHFCVLSLRYYSNQVIQQCSLWLVFPSLYFVWHGTFYCNVNQMIRVTVFPKTYLKRLSHAILIFGLVRIRST